MKSFTRFHFCPRCADPSIEVYMKNAIHCTACGYIYFHNVAAAVAAIIEIEGKVLLLRRAHEPQKGLLDLPGGFVDYKESLDQALAREVMEETSLAITDIRYFGSFANVYHYCEVTYFTADAVFLCRSVDPGALKLSEETSDYCLVDPKTMDQSLLAFDSVKESLSRYGRA
jgi:NADH pyrophosphatase NudC (nudix superfamily)